jgi:hypothetical protein
MFRVRVNNKAKKGMRLPGFRLACMPCGGRGMPRPYIVLLEVKCCTACVCLHLDSMCQILRYAQNDNVKRGGQPFGFRLACMPCDGRGMPRPYIVLLEVKCCTTYVYLYLDSMCQILRYAQNDNAGRPQGPPLHK